MLNLRRRRPAPATPVVNAENEAAAVAKPQGYKPPRAIMLMFAIVCIFAIFIAKAIDRVPNHVLKRRAINLPNVPQSQQCVNNLHVAMTFDRNISAIETPQIINILKGFNLHGAFHVSASQLQSSPELPDMIKALYGEGHIIGLKAEFQPEDLAEVVAPGTPGAETKIGSALIAQSDYIKSLIGVYPRFLRVPISKEVKNIVQIAESMGFRVTWWNIEGKNEVCEPVSTEKSLVSISCISTDAFKTFILDTQNRGYVFVPMDVCLGFHPSVMYRKNRGSLGYTEELVLSDIVTSAQANGTRAGGSEAAAAAAGSATAGEKKASGSRRAAATGISIALAIVFTFAFLTQL